MGEAENMATEAVPVRKIEGVKKQKMSRKARCVRLLHFLFLIFAF